MSSSTTAANATAGLLRNVVQQLRPLPPRRRVDLLISRPDARAILARLPVQDTFELVKTVGMADCMELLELCPPKVVQGFLDLGVWHKDRLDPRLLASMYTALFHANPEHAVDTVLEMDTELMTLFLKLHTRVIDIIDGIPEEDAEDFVKTPDNKLMIAFVDPPGLPEEEGDPFGLGERGRRLARHAVRTLTESLFRKDPGAATKLFDNVRYEVPSQLEEDALRWRTARMQDLGFVPREEAMAVLAYLDPDTTSLPKPTSPVAPEPQDDEADVALTLFVEPDDRPHEPFLAAGLAALSDEERERVRRELVALTNRVMSARNVPPGEPEPVRGAVRETRLMIDLGLAYRAGGDVKQAGPLLQSASVQALYRVGHSLTLKLQRQAQKLVTKERGTAKQLAALLDPPNGLALAALLGPQPMFFSGLTRPQELQTRPFASLDDLAVAAKALAESAFRLAVGFDVLGVTREKLAGAALGNTNFGEASEITLEILMTTALARVAAGGALDATPLSEEEVQKVRDGLKDAANVARAGDALASVVAEKAPLPGAPTADEARARTGTLAAVLLTRLDEEIRGIPEGEPVDPRFVTRVITRLG